jgi:superfamily II DNA/RNA helicase
MTFEPQSGASRAPSTGSDSDSPEAAIDVTFESLGVDQGLINVLKKGGIVAPFAVQSGTIAAALQGRDVTAKAPTGSGKTLAFGIPLVQKGSRGRPMHPKSLVLAPTRELAAQIAEDLKPLLASRGLRATTVYGGVGFGPQLKTMQRGVDVVVACPGRLLDLMDQSVVRLAQVDFVVVDEADRMADMGFLPDVRRIIDATSPQRQTLLFSATLDGEVDVLVQRYQTNPFHHEVEAAAKPLVDHRLWLVDDTQRMATCADLIGEVYSSIVFTRTRHGADALAKRLERKGLKVAAIHGGRSQAQRDRALDGFRSGRVTALIATDVAARGIHVDDVDLVVQYDLPDDPKDYVHRSGRTGRAGATGRVVTLLNSQQRLDGIRMLKGLDIDGTVGNPQEEGETISLVDVGRKGAGGAGRARGRGRRPGRSSAGGGGGGAHRASSRPGRPRTGR